MEDTSYLSILHQENKNKKIVAFVCVFTSNRNLRFIVDKHTQRRLHDDNPLLQHTRLGSLACSTTDHQEKLDLASPLEGYL